MADLRAQPRRSPWPYFGVAVLLFGSSAALAAASQSRSIRNVPPLAPQSPNPYLSLPGFSETGGTAILSTIGLRRSLSSTQANAAAVIAQEAQRAGAGWIPFAQGLIANAWGESNLNPNALGDSGKSYGLFQLYTGGGLGDKALAAGYTRQQLWDPKINASFFIAECLRTSSVLNAIRSGSAAAVTRAVCIDVERPADRYAKAEQRVDHLNMLFGPVG